jgi:hypothetical protein
MVLSFAVRFADSHSVKASKARAGIVATAKTGWNSQPGGDPRATAAR